MSRTIVFVCTKDGCDAGPWEGSQDAMEHCAENRGHAYTGKPAEQLDEEAIPASTTETQDTRNHQQRGDSQGIPSFRDSDES